MENLICKVVGHRGPQYTECGPRTLREEYSTLSIGRTDAAGRVHARVLVWCERCGVEFVAARVHVPTIEVPAK